MSKKKLNNWKEEGFGPCHKCDRKRYVNGIDICEPCHLEDIVDMQAAMIEGMRRVVALARLSPDIRLKSAIRDYDQVKIIDATGNVQSR